VDALPPSVAGFDVSGLLGRGGMGIVYKAIDRELDEVIALKVLAPAAGAHPDLVTRFKHEVKVARRLTHPNIARLHDLVEIRGQLCLSMEFIEGRSLRTLLNQESRFAPERVLRYLTFLVPALDLAHSMNIVHRDLKPGNVIVDPRDVPHILDFGIAKSQWLQEHNDGTPIGTPAYMAPEQCVEGVEVDRRADLYSLGVMLYEMCTGQRPFEHRNRLLLIEMHRSRAPKRPRALAPNLPEALESAILRLLQKDPARRFQNAREVLEALDPAPPPAKPSHARRGAGGAAARSKGDLPPVSAMPGRRGKVLVADDDPLVRKTLGAQMRARQMIVLEAEDGAKAVEATMRELPDLILLDIRMPILDGLEALRLIKNDPRTRDIPIIVMSGLRDPGHIAFSKEHGAANFLDKPIPGDVLDLLLERYFG
jgi:CheY-like chemotaxis protein